MTISARLAASGCRLAYVPPPYEEPIPFPGGSAVGLPRGSVLLIECGEPERVNSRSLNAVVRELRRRFSLAVALRLPAADSPAALRLLSHTCSVHTGVWLLGDHPLRSTLWRWLTDPVDLAGEWLGWLRLHRSVSHRSAEFIPAIIDLAPECRTPCDLFQELPAPERTIRNHLQQDDLPKVERWLHGSRLLHAQLQLQRDPKLSTLDVAEALGYAEEMGFSNQVVQLFGTTADVSRRLLGLEWRFHAWLQRSERPK